MEWVLNWWPEERQDRRMIALSLLVSAIAGYFLFFYSANFSGIEGAVALGSLQSDRSIRIRHARSLQWGTAEKVCNVYLKDTVFIPKGTSAEFQWKDNKITLESESLVQFDEASLDNLEITLIEGKIKTDSRSSKVVKVAKAPVPTTLFFKAKSMPYLSDINSFVLLQSELSSRTLDRLGKKMGLEPLLSVNVPRLNLSRLSDYRLVLKSPEAKTYRLSQKSWIYFAWSPLPLKELDYEVQVDVSEDFRHPISVNAKQSQANILFESPRPYWWRLVARRKMEYLVSESRGFVLDVKQGAAVAERDLTSIEKNEKAQSKKAKRRELTPFEIMFGNPSEGK